MPAVMTVRAVRSAREYRDACDLAEARYQRYGYCHHLDDKASAIPTLVAVEDDRIVGSVQFQSADTQQLPMEYHFGFEAERELSATRREIYEISRLTSAGRTDLLIVASLLAAVLRYAYANAFTVGLAIVKPRLLKVVNGRLGVPTRPVREHAVLEERAGVFAPYLLKPPAPQLTGIWRADAPRYLPSLAVSIGARAEVDLRGFRHGPP
jgi:hypothetical protein